MESKAMRFLEFFVVWICFANPLLIQAAGQQMAPLRVEDVLAAHSFGQYSPVQISPDGKWVAYVVVDNRRIASTATKDRLLTGIAGPPFAGDVCLTEIANGTSRCLTGGKNNN